MYDGDKDRDATSKIRGFLFQDYITIMCLLQKQVKYVCSEYLEDVAVFFEDGVKKGTAVGGFGDIAAVHGGHFL